MITGGQVTWRKADAYNRRVSSADQKAGRPSGRILGLDVGSRRIGVAVSDPLGVGLETRDCAVIDNNGAASSWLFALGPLTRPAWWEITAVPEINLQIDRLVAQLISPVTAHRLTATDFMDMGGGI